MGCKKTTESLLLWGTAGVTAFLTSLFVFSLYGLKWLAIVCVCFAAAFLELWYYGAFAQKTQTASQALIGAVVDVSKALNPSGWVKVHGELWKAECAGKAVPEGARGVVVDVRRSVLIVRNRYED